MASPSSLQPATLPMSQISWQKEQQALNPTPSLDILPPELRLEIYTHYFAALLANDMPRLVNPPPKPNAVTAAPIETGKLLAGVLDPPLLCLSRRIRAECLSLHRASFVPAARQLVRQEKARVSEMLAQGRCFEWSSESAKFGYGEGFGGAVVWSVWIGLRRKVEELERVERVLEEVECKARRERVS